MAGKNGKRKRVLVVDDDPRIVRFVYAYLAAKGFEVQTAASGEAALEKIRDQAPDIILLDMLMPARDGLSVLEELRVFSVVPVIALSANSSVAASALKLGANDFMKKPFNPDELAGRITSLLAATRGKTKLTH